MRRLGIVVTLDESGALQIPEFLCDDLSLTTNENVLFYSEGGDLILEKQTPICVFCKNEEALRNFKGKSVCSSCAKELFESAQKHAMK